MEIQATKIFNSNYNARAKIVVNRGGTRSSKTYSLLQLWLVLSFERKGINIAVCRKTFPALRLSALNDFISILAVLDVTHLFHYHKTEHTFTNKQTGSKIFFLALDNPQKIRGVAFDYVHLEEANELPFETFRQIILRLKPSGRIYISFNPSDSNVWINTEIEQKREDYSLIKSSYKDNAFLQPEQVAEIEYLKTTDLSYWNIFGLGEYGLLTNKVFNNYEIVKDSIYDNMYGELCYGLDYGYNDKTALVQIKYRDGAVYVKELLYKSYITSFNKEITAILKKQKFGYVYADHNYPSESHLIRQAGYQVYNAQKEVAEGLSFCRKFKLYISESSVNLIKELQKYVYKTDPNGRIMEEVVSIDDHAIDAMRYAIYSHLRLKVFTNSLKTNN